MSLSLCSAYSSRLPFSINEIPENPAAIGNWNILIFSDRSDRTLCDSSHFWIHRRLRGQCFLAADPLLGGFKPSQRVADRHPKVGSFSLKCWSHRQPLRCLRFLPLLLFQSHPEKKKNRPLGFAPSRRSRGCSAALPASVGSEHHIYAVRLILSGWVDCPSCGCRISYLKIRWLGWSSQKKWIIDDNWMAAIIGYPWYSMIYDGKLSIPHLKMTDQVEPLEAASRKPGLRRSQWGSGSGFQKWQCKYLDLTKDMLVVVSIWSL